MTAQPTTDAIWTHLSSDLRRFIRRRVPDDHVADDLLQETFMRVHRNIGTLQEADRLAAAISSLPAGETSWTTSQGWRGPCAEIG